MSYFLVVNWFVHALNKIAVLGIPLGTCLAVQGAAIMFAVDAVPLRAQRRIAACRNGRACGLAGPYDTLVVMRLANSCFQAGNVAECHEGAMDRYRETAFYLTLWYAFLTVLVAVLADRPQRSRRADRLA